MTEMRRNAGMDALPPPFNHAASLRPMQLLGGGWPSPRRDLSQGVLGCLSLVTVLENITWISLGVVRHFAERLRRACEKAGGLPPAPAIPSSSAKHGVPWPGPPVF